MPIVTTTPYDTAEYVLNLARALCNDAALSISGNLLADSQPYTFVLLNSAYRYMQDELANLGVETLRKEAVLANFPAVASQDPASQAFISYVGSFDGVNSHTSPVLPGDLMIPLKLWERNAGTVQQFNPMLPVNDGLPSRPKGNYLGEWDYHGDSIYMVGALLPKDLRVLYLAYLPDLADKASSVLIARAANALAQYTAMTFANARGSPLAEGFKDKGDMYLNQIVQRSTRRGQRGNHRRQGYSRRTNSGWASW